MEEGDSVANWMSTARTPTFSSLDVTLVPLVDDNCHLLANLFDELQRRGEEFTIVIDSHFAEENVHEAFLELDGAIGVPLMVRLERQCHASTTLLEQFQTTFKGCAFGLTNLEHS